MKVEKLQQLGFSKGQIKVYSAVLELGISNINRIQEKTGLERRSIYDILNKLIEKGYISYSLEKGKRSYQCTHPNKILEEIHKKEEELKELEHEIPDFISLYETVKPDISAEVFRGNEAIKALLEEMLDYKESFWLGGNSFDEYKKVGKGLQLWFEQWMKRRVKKKHLMHDLVDHGTYLKELKPGNIETHKKNYYKYCQLPEKLRSPMVVIIFGNKVAQVIWGNQPFAFVLESKDVKESFMKYFNYFWKEPW